MAGTTTNYGFTYPTSSDLVRDGATAMQTLATDVDSFIAGSSGLGKLFEIVENQLITTAATCASVGSFANLTTGPNSGTFDLGKSGVCIIVTQARISNATGGYTGNNFISTNLTGGISASAAVTRAGITTGTGSQTVSFIDIIDGTPGATVTYNVQGQVSSASTMNITWSKVTVINLG